LHHYNRLWPNTTEAVVTIFLALTEMPLPSDLATSRPVPPGVFPTPLDVVSRDYAAACANAGIPGGLSGAIDRYRAFHRDGFIPSPSRISEPTPAAAPIHRILRSDSAEGVVTKFTQQVPRLLDAMPEQPDAPSLETETVVIPMIGRKGVLTHTLCVSSQVGCAMGCTFCQTAQMGLIRHLRPREIVQQWWAARHILGVDTITNIVFMGMGEPLDNLDNVIAAIAILTDHSGPAMPMSKISVSTVGRIDGLRRLGEQVRQPGWHRLNLAVSLNAPTDAIRSTIMPINRAMPLRPLREAIQSWPIYGAAKICFEYVLIPGVNDSHDDARHLADYILGRAEWAAPSGHGGSERAPLPGLVNVIPYNPRDNSPWTAPSEDQVISFLGWLLDEGVYAKRRRTKGRDQMAACGQLGNPALRKTRVYSVGTGGT
jgi:23S rRNA (adenine2503-C2)-methyltransferase